MADLAKMRNEIKKIVQRDDVKYVIGYEKGTYGWRVSPSFARTPEEVDKFIFSPLCVNNLAVYLVLEEKLPLPKGVEEEKKKIGIVVKGCDSRSVVQLVQEKAISRDDVVILGVPCSGVVDPRKMKEMFGKEIGTVAIEDKGEKYVIVIDGKKREVLKEELVSENCKTCQYQNPVISDILIGDEIKEKKEQNYSKVKELEEKSTQERWDYWKEKFEKCIRCYACRNCCPVCNCKECMAEKTTPVWIRRSVNLSENAGFHIMRSLHTAGRCIGCGSCERVCPMNIPLSKLYKKVEKDVIELFDYRAGLDEEEKPLLSVYSVDDSNEYIL
jgi:coenzyme F420-reducing hydrogenase beta subunit